MRIRGILLGYGQNNRGYRWIDVEGLRLDVGKNGIRMEDLESLKGKEVEAFVQVDWRRTASGGWFARRRVLAIRGVDG